ncbi:MAG: MTAP family purine nucleoside phosphorylase [Armatimonadota bacterium]
MRYGIIAGTGIEAPDIKRSWEVIDTPYGEAYISRIQMGGQDTALLRRHGPGLNVPPHLINYRSNIWALKSLGVEYVFATAAVGSLRRSLCPGAIIVVDDFIDFTKRRVCTYFDNVGETVVHTDFSVPYSHIVTSSIRNASLNSGIDVGPGVVYVCVDGPRYETPAEIRMFAQWGGDIVGMTGVPEVVLAKETGINYGMLAIVTNYAAGIIEQRLSHEEVVACVNSNRQHILDIIDRSIYLIEKSL